MKLSSETHLEICGTCSGSLVHPVEWEPVGTAHWQIELRCPECEWAGTGVFDQETVERFDEALEVGADQLLSDLKAIERANMHDYAERFVAALEAGQLLPEDF